MSGQPPVRPSGHSVLQLPVPPLQEWVTARTAHYDAGFVSADPRFAQAHITALGPFDPAPDRHTLDAIDVIAAATEPITVTLDRLAQFPHGLIYLCPEPDGALRDLTARLAETFPDYPPYGGAFGPSVDPHVTLDAAAADVTLDSTRAALGDIVPVTCEITELQLAWWESDHCHVRHVWTLG